MNPLPLLPPSTPCHMTRVYDTDNLCTYLFPFLPWIPLNTYLFPFVPFQTSNEDAGAPSSSDNSSGYNKEITVPVTSSLEQCFVTFSSLEFSGQVYMTPLDFLQSLTSEKPRETFCFVNHSNPLPTSFSNHLFPTLILSIKIIYCLMFKFFVCLFPLVLMFWPFILVNEY